MASLRYRLAALEGATKNRLKPSVRACVLILTCEATPEQQAALDDARRTRRPILIIRGHMPEMPSGYGLIVKVGNESLETNIKPKFDKATMRQDVWGR